MTLTAVAPEETAPYLQMFASRGPDGRRDPAVDKVAAAVAEHDGVLAATVWVLDARHGPWRMVIDGARPVSTFTSERDSTPATTMKRLLESGTWQPDTCSGMFRTTRHSFAGYEHMEFSFESLTVVEDRFERDPGTCTVCGGRDFVLEALASLPVRLIGDHDTLEVCATTLEELAGDIRLQDMFVTLKCQTCATATSDSFGRTPPLRIGSSTLSRSGIRAADLVA